MPIPSHPINSGQTTASNATGSLGSRGNERSAAGPDNLFARIASSMEQQAPADTEQGLLATPVETNIDSSEAPQNTLQPPVIEDLSSLIATVSEPTADPALLADAPHNTETATDSPEPAALQGIPHAIAVLEANQSRQAGRSENTAGRGDPLVNALQTLKQLSGVEPGPAAQAARPQPATDISGQAQNVASGQQPLVLPNMSEDQVATLEQVKQMLLGKPGAEGVRIALDKISMESSPVSNAAQPVTQVNSAGQPQLRIDASQGVVKLDLPGNIGQPAWQQALAERVVMASAQNLKQVELQLHPAELGQVNIRIETAQDRAAVQFTAMHADTREALDAALPRLREMFTQQGMELVHADVQQQHSQQQDAQSSTSSLLPEELDEASPATLASASLQPGMHRPAHPTSLLDLYA